MRGAPPVRSSVRRACGRVFHAAPHRLAGADYRLAASRRRRRLLRFLPEPAPAKPLRRGERSCWKCAPDRYGRRWLGRHRRPRLPRGRCRRAPTRLPVPGRANRRAWRASRGRRRGRFSTSRRRRGRRVSIGRCRAKQARRRGWRKRRQPPDAGRVIPALRLLSGARQGGPHRLIDRGLFRPLNGRLRSRNLRFRWRRRRLRRGFTARRLNRNQGGKGESRRSQGRGCRAKRNHAETFQAKKPGGRPDVPSPRRAPSLSSHEYV